MPCGPAKASGANTEAAVVAVVCDPALGGVSWLWSGKWRLDPGWEKLGLLASP